MLNAPFAVATQDIRLSVTTDGDAVVSIALDGRATQPAEGTAQQLVERELLEYLAGHRQRFTFPRRAEGTPFQRRVWQALEAIPYGTTRTYGEIARTIGQPGAARAVGQANNRNPIPIVIPCHRVLASGGKLGGYGGGLVLKRRLLALEGAWS